MHRNTGAEADRQQAGSYKSGAVVVRTSLGTPRRVYGSPIRRSAILISPVGASLLAIQKPMHPTKAAE